MPPKAIKSYSDLGLAPYHGNWGPQERLHLLRRCLFGVTQTDDHYFSNLTLSGCLDTILAQSPFPSPPLNTYNSDKFVDPDVPFGETWISSNKEPDKGTMNYLRRCNLKAWWTGCMLNQDRSITQKMILFWHNHLAAEFEYMVDARTNYSYVEPLIKNSLGNFKELILEITKSPGMLQYLSGNANTSSAPNENYARELQELFTVGKGRDFNYTQDDILAAARVLTGLTTDKVELHSAYSPFAHDSDNKKFSSFYGDKIIQGRMGKGGEEEVSEMIDMIFSVKEVAKYTCRALYRWFLSSEINNTIEINIIEPLAEIFIKNDFEIKPVLRSLLNSEHFFDPIYIGCQIKNPVDFLIGVCRQFDVSTFPADIRKQYQEWMLLWNQLEVLSMAPGSPPNVAGWVAYYLAPGYDKLWINSNTLVRRNSITDQLSSTQGLIDMETGSGITLNLDLLSFTTRCPDPSDVYRFITDSTSILCPISFDSIQIDILTDILMSSKENNDTWPNVWKAYLSNPDDQPIRHEILSRLNRYYTYIFQRGEYQLL